MEQQFSLTGDEICNEFDCPLVELSQNIFIVDPKVIMGPVSIVHSCTQTCQVYREPSTCSYEREVVSVADATQVVFKHDLSNRLYCINIYCIGNYFH